MNAIRRWLRRTAAVVVGTLAFGQVSLAAAACEMDRRALAQITVAGAGHRAECEEHAAGVAPLSTNRCMSHCTADLQIHSAAGAAICGHAGACALPPAPRVPPDAAADRHFPPRVAIPIRILLHAYLV